MTVTYLIAFLVAAALTLALTPLVIRWATAMNLVDTPSLRKVHTRAVPRLGGVALAAAMVAGAAAALIAAGVTSLRGAGGPSFPVGALLLVSTSIMLMGLVDDVLTLRAQVKLLTVVAGAVVLCRAGIRLDSIHLGGGAAIELGRFSWPLTVLWITLVTVSINFIDGLDGLAAGIAAVASAAIAALAASAGQVALAVVTLALMGSLTSFLVYNFNPARVFMGDSGSMFIGFTLGACSVAGAARSREPLAWVLPMLALAIPLLDTLFTMVRRGILERRSIFSAERGHIHHKLMDRGWSHRRVVLILYAATGGVVAAVYWSASGPRPGRWTSSAVLSLVVLLLLFYAAGAARPGELIRALRRNRAIRREIVNGRRVFEGGQLSLRATTTVEAWWRELCEAARLLGAFSLRMTMERRRGDPRVFTWDNEEIAGRTGARGAQTHARYRRSGRPLAGPTASALSINVPVRHRRVGGPVILEADLAVQYSFESAGHRAAMLARLIDECPLARLPGGAEHPAQPPRHRVAKRRGNKRTGVPAGAAACADAGSKVDPERNDASADLVAAPSFAVLEPAAAGAARKGAAAGLASRNGDHNHNHHDDGQAPVNGWGGSGDLFV